MCILNLSTKRNAKMEYMCVSVEITLGICIKATIDNRCESNLQHDNWSEYAAYGAYDLMPKM